MPENVDVTSHIIKKGLKYSILIGIPIWSIMLMSVIFTSTDFKKHVIAFWIIILLLAPFLGGLIGCLISRRK